MIVNRYIHVNLLAVNAKLVQRTQECDREQRNQIAIKSSSNRLTHFYNLTQVKLIGKEQSLQKSTKA